MLNLIRAGVLLERTAVARGQSFAALSPRTGAIRQTEDIRGERSTSLAERVGEGDAAALGEFYDVHHQVVRAFAQRMLGDPVAAEDLVQEVFISAPKAFRRFRGESPARTFLLSIAANRCRRFVRSVSRRAKATERFAQEVPSAELRDGAVRRSELREVLEREIAKLPFDQRVALVLCSVEERSSSEVAQILGIPEGTVRTRHFHARQKLRELMTRQGYP